ncbi:MAG: hypothetical protein Q8O55_06595 [Dehalococcoidales bacterium]|nr:hypothetical protein [Dehalococcoidales bacterium]
MAIPAVTIFGYQWRALIGLLDAKGIITTDELIEATAKEGGITVEELRKAVAEIKGTKNA